MPNNLKFYYIDTKYVNYLKETESHIWENDDKGRTRPYIGVVLSINGYKYYAPLSSPKPKHKAWKDSLDFIRIDYKGELKGVINLNNIIPVSEENITMVDINAIKTSDIKYYHLLLSQIIIIRKKQAVIRKKANIIYNIVTNHRKGNENLIMRCYSFKKLEQKCEEFNNR